MTSYNLKTLWGMLLTLISILVFQDGKVKYYKELKKECLGWLSRRKLILNPLIHCFNTVDQLLTVKAPRKSEFSKI